MNRASAPAPCPLCGEVPAIVASHTEESLLWGLRHVCLTPGYHNHERAIAEWNKRVEELRHEST